MNTTSDVLDNHLASFGRGDLEAILSDYAPGAVLFTPAGPLEGIDAIRPLFVGLLAEFAKPGASFDLKHRTIHGDHAYILWSAETADNRYDLATYTFVVRGGKIVAQSFAANQVDAAVAGLFLVFVALIVVGCARDWSQLLTRSKAPELHECPYVPLAERA